MLPCLRIPCLRTSQDPEVKLMSLCSPQCILLHRGWTLHLPRLRYVICKFICYFFIHICDFSSHSSHSSCFCTGWSDGRTRNVLHFRDTLIGINAEILDRHCRWWNYSFAACCNRIRPRSSLQWVLSLAAAAAAGFAAACSRSSCCCLLACSTCCSYSHSCSDCCRAIPTSGGHLLRIKIAK